MPVSGAGDAKAPDAAFSVRFIDGVEAERARLRMTFMYFVTPEFSLGVEMNPIAQEVGPLANWRIIDETEELPAVIVGTSSDRIGTPHGQSFYGTVSKNLDPLIGIPVSPYVGVSYGTFDDEFVPIGGLTIRYSDVFSSSHQYDGKSIHHMISATIAGQHTISLLLVDHEHLGFTYGVTFSF